MPKPSIIALDRHAELAPWPDFDPAEIASGSRAQKGLMWLEDKARGLSCGVWEADANTCHMAEYPVNEFIIVLEGEVVMIEPDRRTVIRAGESFVIPKGCRCSWSQPGRVRKVFVIFDDASGAHNKGPLHVIKFDPRVKLAPSTPPAPAMLQSPVPVQHAHDYFTDATGQFTTGLWDTTGYHRKLIDFPRHELMHLLEGSVTFTDDEGQSRTFNAGDTFFVPLGTPNAWKSEGYLRKIYCIFQPAG